LELLALNSFIISFNLMPKPIPPPPPQPSSQDTTDAVRFIRMIMLIMIVGFFGISQCYHRDALVVDYGRETTHAWTVWRAHHLDMEARRAHDGGKIVWLIGSSILREAFDEAKINKKLAQTGSEYRIVKLGLNRGAAGIIFGMLQHAKVQKGDIVLHNIAIANFKKDWFTSINLPAHQLMELYNPEDFWGLREWTLADKLEQSSAIPAQFYTYHESYMNGLENWFTSAVQGTKPEKIKPGYRTRFLKIEEKEILEPSLAHYGYIGENILDFSDGQINIIGLRKITAFCQQLDVPLFLIDIPPRQQYIAELVHQQTLAQWYEWRDQLEVHYFPQQPEGHYYDLTHPNYRGRKNLSSYLIKWLSNPQKEEPSVVSWPIPEYNK
jgi:hypothetical protein